MKRLSWLKIAGIFLVLLVISVVLWLVLPPGPDLPRTWQGPNGYSNLIQAAKLIQSSLPKDPNDTPMEELQAFVNKQKDALALAREGLAKPCHVVVDYSADYLFQHPAHLAELKRLAQAMIAEGKLADRQHRPADALRAYSDTILISKATCQGGDVIDKLVSLAMDAIACRHLTELVENLNAAEAKTAIKNLADYDAQEEPMENIMQQEKIFVHRAYGLKERFAYLFTFPQRQAMETNIRKKSETGARERRQLMVNLAARAFEVEKGAPPASLQDLSPAYLKTIPPEAVLPKK